MNTCPGGRLLPMPEVSRPYQSRRKFITWFRVSDRVSEGALPSLLITRSGRRAGRHRQLVGPVLGQKVVVDGLEGLADRIEHADLAEHGAESFVDAAWGGVCLGNLV